MDLLVGGGVDADEPATLRKCQPDTALAVQCHAIRTTFPLNIDFVHNPASGTLILMATAYKALQTERARALLEVQIYL